MMGTGISWCDSTILSEICTGISGCQNKHIKKCWMQFVFAAFHKLPDITGAFGRITESTGGHDVNSAGLTSSAYWYDVIPCVSRLLTVCTKTVKVFICHFNNSWRNGFNISFSSVNNIAGFYTKGFICCVPFSLIFITVNAAFPAPYFFFWIPFCTPRTPFEPIFKLFDSLYSGWVCAWLHKALSAYGVSTIVPRIINIERFRAYPLFALTAIFHACFNKLFVLFKTDASQFSRLSHCCFFCSPHCFHLLSKIITPPNLIVRRQYVY